MFITSKKSKFFNVGVGGSLELRT